MLNSLVYIAFKKKTLHFEHLSYSWTTANIWSLFFVKYWFTELHIFSNCSHVSLSIISKWISLSSNLSFEKSSSIEKLLSSWWQIQCYKVLPESANVINVFIQMLSDVLPGVPGLLHSFFRKYFPNIHAEIAIF